MGYAEFKRLVAAMCWTIPQLRCDEPPSEDLLVLIDAIGLGQYERFVLALQAEQLKQQRVEDEDHYPFVAEGDARYYRPPGAVDR